MFKMEPSTSKATKRKREVLTIEKKLEIILELEKGSTATGLSAKHGISRTTINDIKKNAEEIKRFASQMESDSGAKKRKTMRKATNESLDEALFLWFLQKRSEGVPISGPILCERALYFNKQLNYNPLYYIYLLIHFSKSKFDRI